ncbi:alpha/beta hydrolase-fold protein [Micromonospora sp. NPDC050495]|uniref:alpha/beta hydrolase n=1 Tax=Micromonospora sp. NPDC050495 TaxID=3154936 RepID=UPI0033FD9866
MTDASLTFSLVVGLMNSLGLVREIPELIVIGVGAADELDAAEFSRRRVHELYPLSTWVNGGPGRALIEAVLSPEMLTGGGGADSLLSFLVDELRPQLAAEFRFDESDHGITGLSAGGHFVGYTLFSRPEAFGKCLAGSPPLSGCEDLLFTLEAKHAAAHSDLPAKVFFGAGEGEVADVYLAAADVVGSMTRMAQMLRLRNYPSLELTCRVYPGQTHASVAPYVLSEGLRALYPIVPPDVEEQIEAIGAGPSHPSAETEH